MMMLIDHHCVCVWLLWVVSILLWVVLLGWGVSITGLAAHQVRLKAWERGSSNCLTLLYYMRLYWLSRLYDLSILLCLRGWRKHSSKSLHPIFHFIIPSE